MTKRQGARGSEHHNSTLKEHHVVEIRKRRAAGETVKALAEEFGISSGACSKIINKVTWSHITERSGNTVIHKEEYHIWNAMVQRCYRTSSRAYPEYGGRGIQVCGRWKNSFENFLADMGKRPSKAHSLDRIDPDGHYEPSNLRWATDKVQARNKRNTIRLEWPTGSGQMIAAADIAEQLGESYSSFRQRMIREGKWPTKK